MSTEKKYEDVSLLDWVKSHIRRAYRMGQRGDRTLEDFVAANEPIVKIQIQEHDNRQLASIREELERLKHEGLKKAPVLVPVLVLNTKLYAFKAGVELPEKPRANEHFRMIGGDENDKQDLIEKDQYWIDEKWLYQLESLATPIEEGSLEKVKALLPTNKKYYPRGTSARELVIETQTGLHHIEAEFEVVTYKCGWKCRCGCLNRSDIDTCSRCCITGDKYEILDREFMRLVS